MQVFVDFLLVDERKMPCSAQSGEIKHEVWRQGETADKSPPISTYKAS